MKLKRIQRKRTAGWKMPENTVYVGRPTKWGNPFKVGDKVGNNHKGEEIKITSNMQAVEIYKNYLALQNIDLSELKDKNLACWCKEGTPCHADVLLELANNPSLLNTENK